MHDHHGPSRRLLRLLVASLLMQDAHATHNIAFVGNSIQYFYDVPRLFEALSGEDVNHDCCFRGGATLTSLLEKGNGMRNKFGSPNAQRADGIAARPRAMMLRSIPVLRSCSTKVCLVCDMTGTFDIGAPTVDGLLSGACWDFVILNDFTLHPAREATRSESVTTLKQGYAPLILAAKATPILIMTYAYRRHTTEPPSEDLGEHPTFTRRLAEGIGAYATALAEVLPPEHAPRVAPLGLAMQAVHDERPDLWETLFHCDDRHLSARGAYLEVCVLHCTVFGEAPPAATALPEDPAVLYARARYLQPPDAPANPLPTREEAVYLRDVAERVCRSYQAALCFHETVIL